jgi:hypothetical protein
MKSSVAVRVLAILCAFVCFGMALSCGSGGAATASAKLTQISISPANQTIAKGSTLQLSAIGTYDDGTTQAVGPSGILHRDNPSPEMETNNGEGNVKRSQPPAPTGKSEGTVTEALGSVVTWQTSQPAVATIDSQGVVTAMGPGVTQVSATYQGVTGTTPVTVGQPALMSIAVTPKQSSLPIGESERATATGSFSDGSTRDLTQSATWTSSTLNIASVNAQGVVTGAGVGVVQVSAAYEGVTGIASVTVGRPALLSITVSPNQTSLPSGELEQLAATGNFSDGSTQNLTQSATWSSSSAVVNVNAQGVVTGVSSGVAQVSAAYQGVTGSASVTVGGPGLVAITVSPNQSSLPLGETKQLTAMGSFSDGSTQNLTPSATWISSSQAVASVNAQGIVTAVGVGATQLSATYQGITGVASVAVAQPVLLTITVSPSQSSLPLGETEPLIATGSFSDGSSRNLSQSAAWTSSSAVASVNAQGVVTGINLGSALVSAAYQGITGSASVTVGTAALLSITVSPAQYSLPAGESTQLAAIGNFSNGSTRNLTQSATWSSSSAIASVSAAGAVIANAVGASTISASAGSVTGSANLTVTPAVVVGLSIIPATISLVIENSKQLQAMASMSDSTTQNMTLSVTWNSAQPAIASVTYYGLATAQQVGSTTIEAEVNGISGSASITVTPLLAVSYFNLANTQQTGFDSTVRLTNPGVTSGNLCAMVYVFDSKEVLNECCGCTISDSGLLTLSLAKDLTSNTLTGKKPAAGVIEVVPSNPGQNGQCNAASISPNGVILGWSTNVLPSSTNVQVTEESFAQTQLSNSEAGVLAGECSMIQQLGSGAGVCSCGTGGN